MTKGCKIKHPGQTEKTVLTVSVVARSGSGKTTRLENLIPALQQRSGRVEQARQYFDKGKRYLDGLEVLLCKIAGYWYYARFEDVLNTIERDRYMLRPEYSARRKPSSRLKTTWLNLLISVRHIRLCGPNHRTLSPKD